MTLLEDAYAAYVNLDSRPDRRAHMETELARVGVAAERVRGPLPVEVRSERTRVMWDRTPGAIGCWFGQVAVMIEALRRGRHALVLEDDLVFCSDLRERLAVLESFLTDRHWDVVWLGGTFHVNPPVWHRHTPGLGRDAELTEHPRVVRTYGAFSTHAYLVNRASAANVLLTLDRNLETSVGIDTTFIGLQPDLQTFAFVPGCVKQYDNRSDIGNGDTIFSGFAKLGPHWWADRMEEFDPSTYDWAEART